MLGWGWGFGQIFGIHIHNNSSLYYQYHHLLPQVKGLFKTYLLSTNTSKISNESPKVIFIRIIYLTVRKCSNIKYFDEDAIKLRKFL